MNKPLAIILLVILALILVLLLRVFIPAVTNYLEHLPKGVFVILFIVILAVMGYLIYFLVTPKITGGETENVLEEPSIGPEGSNTDVFQEKIENCIILRNDQIWIDNVQVDMNYVEKYIDEHVESNTPLIILDDYSLASLHHQITELCDKKGVNYTKEDEEGIKH